MYAIAIRIYIIAVQICTLTIQVYTITLQLNTITVQMNTITIQMYTIVVQMNRCKGRHWPLLFLRILNSIQVSRSTHPGCKGTGIPFQTFNPYLIVTYYLFRKLLAPYSNSYSFSNYLTYSYMLPVCQVLSR